LNEIASINNTKDILTTQTLSQADWCIDFIRQTETFSQLMTNGWWKSTHTQCGRYKVTRIDTLKLFHAENVCCFHFYIEINWEINWDTSKVEFLEIPVFLKTGKTGKTGNWKQGKQGKQGKKGKVKKVTEWELKQQFLNGFNVDHN
jgi:hypothetical protein